MTHRFSRKQEPLVLTQGLCPGSMSFILALGHLRRFVLPDTLLLDSIYMSQRGVNVIKNGNALRGGFSQVTPHLPDRLPHYASDSFSQERRHAFPLPARCLLVFAF